MPPGGPTLGRVSSDLHRAFPHPAHSDGSDVAGFLLAADRLPAFDGHAARCARVPRSGPGARWWISAVARAGRPRGWLRHTTVRGWWGGPQPGADRRSPRPEPGGRPEWLCADLTTTRLPPASVDVVRTERVLMYMPDLAAAVDPLLALLRPGGRIVAFELDYGATLLAPGRASDDIVRAATAYLERSLPQPWAGRRLPGLLHHHGLTVTAEPHAFTVDAAVWRRIVRDSIAAASTASSRTRPAPGSGWPSWTNRHSPVSAPRSPACSPPRFGLAEGAPATPDTPSARSQARLDRARRSLP